MTTPLTGTGIWSSGIRYGDRGQALDRGTGNRLGGVVPATILRGTEVGTVEDLLQTQDLDATLARLLDQRQVLLEHRLLNLRDGTRLIV